ncbi:MAG: hydantoinase/oxoprolinase family protein [Deltaproteobacteria bacterium]
MIRIGIDTGGTFTDFVLYGPTGLRTLKLPSTPDDPCRAILAGIDQLLTGREETEIIHGTTVATNAFLERKGARTLVVATRGFEDVLLIGRQNRPRIYDLEVVRSRPVIDRAQITGVSERVLFDGSIRKKLASSAGKRLRRLCRQQRIESVAICLLHSYANGEHERKLGRELASLKLPITLSSELLPEFREYERSCTTLINAYLSPVISAYIERLRHKLAAKTRLFIQQSNGGILPAAGIDNQAVHTILSGPAGGVQGAFSLAKQLGLDKIITFDMGGTSTDVSLCDGTFTLTRDYTIDGYPIRNQVIDIHTVGAGGGSIAWRDAGGLLQVGPQSAGAAPGPVCYGNGREITVTDANLLLGRIPDRLLGGKMKLHRDRAAKYCHSLGQQFSLASEKLALGIIKIVNAGMAQAVRAVSVERGYDPKEFTLFSFGGASGVHCCELARELGMQKIVIPAKAGILSAQGMVLSDPTLDFSQTLFLKNPRPSDKSLLQMLARLESKAFGQAEELGLGGDLIIEKFLDLRYKGQSYELTVPFAENFIDRFHSLHEQHFGYRLYDEAVELVTTRLTLRAAIVKEPLPPAAIPAPSEKDRAVQTSLCFANGVFRKVAVLQRSLLQPEEQILGPALILDTYTTILVTEDFSARADRFGNLLLVGNDVRQSRPS